MKQLKYDEAISAHTSAETFIQKQICLLICHAEIMASLDRWLTVSVSVSIRHLACLKS